VATSADVRGACESLETADRREIIRALAEIYIDAPGRGARKFDPDTVRIVWRYGVA
jgi:hypothetical protein